MNFLTFVHLKLILHSKNSTIAVDPVLSHQTHISLSSHNGLSAHSYLGLSAKCEQLAWTPQWLCMDWGHWYGWLVAPSKYQWNIHSPPQQVYQQGGKHFKENQGKDWRWTSVVVSLGWILAETVSLISYSSHPTSTSSQTHINLLKPTKKGLVQNQVDTMGSRLSIPWSKKAK